MNFSHLYWRFGFQSRLYDALAPEAYLESIRRLVKCIPMNINIIVPDAGCGSWLILKYLKPKILEGSYIGVDLLLEGLALTRIKA